MNSLDFLAPRHSFLPPIPQLDEAADLLDHAATMIMSQLDDRARELISQADIPELYAFATKITGKMNPEIHPVRKVLNIPATLLKRDRLPPLSSNLPVGRDIFKRDGWRSASVRAEWFPLRFERTSICASQEQSVGTKSRWMDATRGSWLCGELSTTSFHTQDPRSREPIVDRWDGLTRLLACKWSPLVGEPVEVSVPSAAVYPPTPDVESLDGLVSDKAREAAELLFGSLRQIGCKVGLISGQKSISAIFSDAGRKPVRVLDLDRHGKVWIGLGNLVDNPAFQDENIRRQYLHRLRAVSSLKLSSAEKYPSFPIDNLMQTTAWIGLTCPCSSDQL